VYGSQEQRRGKTRFDGGGYAGSESQQLQYLKKFTQVLYHW
jgi:hypothetical protein